MDIYNETTSSQKQKGSVGVMTTSISFRKILIIIFCAGILFCGIGVGIAFMEYSSFEYLGQKNMGSDEIVSETFTKDLYKGETEEDSISYIRAYGLGDISNMTLETSKKVAKDKIQFVIEYNPNHVSSISIGKVINNKYFDYDYDSGEYCVPASAEYYINGIIGEKSQIEAFMEYKNEILENIKQKQFYEYNYECIYSIKVIVHPSNKDLICLDAHY